MNSNRSEGCSAVIPAYNAEKTIGELITRLNSVLAASESAYEIIIVDDGCRDATVQKAAVFTLSLPVKIISLDKNYGQQNAVFCGIQNAEYKRIICLDADLEHPPEAIPLLLAKLNEGFDCVYAVRDTDTRSRLRGLGSRLKTAAFNLLTDNKNKLPVSSFRILNGSLADRMALPEYGFVYVSALIFSLTGKITYITINYRETKTAGASLFRLLKTFCKLLIYYSPGLKCLRIKKPLYKIKNIVYGKNTL
jgi:undecaprenyl-phosphate 4-deoxy-4-formamido-L-arabinose transferase